MKQLRIYDKATMTSCVESKYVGTIDPKLYSALLMAAVHLTNAPTEAIFETLLAMEEWSWVKSILEFFDELYVLKIDETLDKLNTEEPITASELFGSWKSS